MYVYSQPQLDPKEYLELKLLSVYYDIFQQEVLGMNISPNLQKFLKKLKKCYFQRIISSEDSVINFDCPQMRCSYVFQFAASFSSIIAHYFSKILKCIPWLTEKLLLCDEINICCLGGGPATEFVAIVIILEDMLWRHCPRGDRPLKVNATVIDINHGWKGTVKKINESLAQFVDTSLLKYQLSFVHADLTKSLSDEIRSKLSSSDIVTMSKFMTSIHGTSGTKDVIHTFQAVFQNIREDGILLFLDSSGFEHYNVLSDVAKSFEDIFQIYGLWEHEVYEMSHIFLEQCFRFYSRFYNPYKSCCFKSRNYVSAWHRRNISSIKSETFFKTAGNENAYKKKKLQRSASF